jgi:hypothetical protein
MSKRLTIIETTGTDTSHIGRAPAYTLGFIVLLVGMVVNPGATIVLGALFLAWRSRVNGERRTAKAQDEYNWGAW